MKVLLTATVQSHICQFHRPLVSLLHENGCEVHVAARNNLAEKNGLKLDFVDKVFDIPFSRSPKSTDNIKAYKELKKIINEENYNIIHCNTPMGGIITRLAAKKSRKKGTKVFYTAHGFHFYKGSSRLNWLVYYPIEKAFSKITDKLITITKEDYQLADKKFNCNTYHIHGVGANSSKFALLSDQEKAQLKESLLFDADTKLILNVGELLPNKNQKSIICAMEKIVDEYPNCKLLIAGNGLQRDNLANLIHEKNLDEKVVLLGYTTELYKFMNIADVLVACSYREGLPLNLMEAMLCKKPIVASNNRGHRELVLENKTGYIVEPEDIDAYAQHVVKLFNDDELCKSMGENAMEYVQSFTDVSVREELKKIYEL